MKQRFILYRRKGPYYCEDTETHQQLSLRTCDEAKARTLLQARNESFRQPNLNLQLARTRDEHQKILNAESNPEWRDFYQLLWHLGGSQTDIATLRADNVDLTNRTVSYSRRKTGSLCLIHFGKPVAEILRGRPKSSFVFPMLALWKQADRGKALIRRCRLAKVSGISLHSYRYAWAETRATLRHPSGPATQAPFARKSTPRPNSKSPPRFAPSRQRTKPAPSKLSTPHHSVNPAWAGTSCPQPSPHPRPPKHHAPAPLRGARVVLSILRFHAHSAQH